MNKRTSGKLKRNLKKPITVLDGILPFTEKPSNQYLIEKNETIKNEIQASELFSFFTADIIKEEVIFTR